MIRRIPILVWFIIPTVIIAGFGIWFFTRPSVLGEKADSDKPVAVSKPVEGTVEFPIVGRNHIAQGTTVSTYNSNPPTSGPHWPAPAKNGIYDTMQPDEQLLHNLEHGYVWISYIPTKPNSESSAEAGVKSGLTEEEVTKLKDLVKGDDWKVVLEPRDKNDSKIALAAWGRLLKMDDPDYDKIRDFIRTYRDRGPEKGPH